MPEGQTIIRSMWPQASGLSHAKCGKLLGIILSEGKCLPVSENVQNKALTGF